MAPRLLRAAGWAVGGELLLAAGSATGEVVASGLPRPDVADAHPGVPGADRSGWEAVIDLRGLRERPLDIVLMARSGTGGWRELDRVGVRVEREAQTAARGRAAFTIVQDEPEFLPIWLAHYGRYFESADLYVLDHDSTDGSTAAVAGSCNVIPVHHDASFDHAWLEATVERFQSFLLQSYETVLFAEADELIVADPEHHAGLDAYVDALDEPVACCTGFDVVHQPSEPPLEPGRPILSQRGSWHPSPDLSKRLIAKVPLAWGQGFHSEWRHPEVEPDPTLYLVHLHRADYDRCLAHHRATAAREWSERDVATGQGYQNRITDEAEFRRWFYGQGLGTSEPQPIPERLRSLL